MNVFDYVRIKKTGVVGRITDYGSAFSEDHFKVGDSWYNHDELEFYAHNDSGKLQNTLAALEDPC